MAGEGYVADRSLATVLYLSLKMGRPLFLEGEAGVGKTEIAKVLSSGLNRPLIRLQCYEGLDISSAVYEWNYAAQMVEIRMKEAGGEIDQDALEKGVFSEKFLIKRPLLQALEGEAGNAPILLIDEAANAARLVLRARVEGNRDDDICWVDDVRIDGAPMGAAATAFDAAGARVRLTASMLHGHTAITGPSPMDAFGPSQNDGAPAHHFEGRLVLNVAAARGGFDVVVDRFSFMPYTDGIGEAGPVARPPPFDVAFVQAGDRLIPAVRGPIASAHPDWEWVLGAGRVWTEPGDAGMTRAAVPFAWMERNANCTHNGMATFLFDDTRVSNVAYQISSQTCLYFQFETWGLASADYAPGAVADADDLRAADVALLARRLPVRPIAALAADVGGDPNQFGSPEEVSPHNMTAFGYVTDGVHYVGGCATDRGAYAACDELILPSYSLAKTMVAGLALMRLEHVSPGARDALIADYVPACAAQGGWDGVTFEHALDMTTGRYVSLEYEVDEALAVEADFFVVDSHAEKIELACGRYPRQRPPGEVFVYHTTDTYILGVAMQAYLRRHVAPDADIYRDLIVEPIWRPLGLSPTLDVTRRTYDGVRQPFTGWGLALTRDDLARIAQFINVDEGRIAGEPVVDAAMLRAALQREPGDVGLPAPSAAYRYNNGVWAWNARQALGCVTPVWIPFMSGYGGLSVALFSNGSTYYYVSDGDEFAWAHAAAESQRIAPFCEGTAP